MIFAHIFISFIYQPFLNILVFFYWGLGLLTNGHPDMGYAVIMLTIVIRLLLLPMSLAEDKSADERRALKMKFQEIEKMYSSDPITERAERKKLFRHNPKFVFAEGLSLFVQTAIALMLWKIFATGLEGQDLHLIYPFMPQVSQPFNLLFLGKFDLSKPNLLLNFMQTGMIFVVETTGILSSSYPPEKGEVVRLQLVLPAISFLVFLNLPAGKKLFVIVTLMISWLIQLYKIVKNRIEDALSKQQAAAAAAAAATAAAEANVSASATVPPIVTSTSTQTASIPIRPAVNQRGDASIISPSNRIVTSSGKVL